ncbi:DUF2141 domain-containing protein [Sphingomonas bacterium]|uniref:DUF2141 domain-containing protein n=1 Tax=Sphingomonas bacterium TaxID=1895847 RepID=UPI001575A4BC|nr:DUF2141 domain-containing protein [Sphingomonas bacterium]
MTHRTLLAPLLALAPVALSSPALAAPLGPDAAACEANKPAILATVVGLKDRSGIIKLELYPPTPEDFTRDDHDLIAEGKTFRRVTVSPPAAGAVSLCIRVPGPGRYALLMTHNRDGQNKFRYTIDGAGLPGNKKIGMSKPKVGAAIVEVGAATLPLTIRAQYLGLLGFSLSSGN